MTDKSVLIEQTNLAFEFIEKLYLEVSYLIKEIEGLLGQEKERFIIGKPSGYGVSCRSSSGLETNNVRLWLLRKLAVFFIPEDKTNRKGGQTITVIEKNLKVFYLRIVLNDGESNEPAVYSGVLYKIQNKGKGKWITKFESIMSHLEYNDSNIFKNAKKISHEDNYIEISGELIKNSLFEINSSENIHEKILKPSLELFRKY